MSVSSRSCAIERVGTVSETVIFMFLRMNQTCFPCRVYTNSATSTQQLIEEDQLFYFIVQREEIEALKSFFVLYPEDPEILWEKTLWEELNFCEK
jgi:hypothetical protein